jgi:hypothetical protein
MKKTLMGFLVIAFMLMITTAAYSGGGPGMKLSDNFGKTSTVMEDGHKKMCEGLLTPEGQKQMCGMMKSRGDLTQEMAVGSENPTITKCRENLQLCMMRMEDVE